MIPIFEYTDVFNGNSFRISDNPLINELQETVREGLIKGEISGYRWDDYGGEWEFTIIGINEYNKYYIFRYIADKYPEYGFLDNEGGFEFKGEFFSFCMKPVVIDIKSEYMGEFDEEIIEGGYNYE